MLKLPIRTLFGFVLVSVVACGGSGGSGQTSAGGNPGTGGKPSAGGAVGTGGRTSTGGSTGGGDVAPDGFWDAGTIPTAKNVMTFMFLNRSNGKFADGQIFWSFKSGAISETHG